MTCSIRRADRLPSADSGRAATDRPKGRGGRAICPAGGRLAALAPVAPLASALALRGRHHPDHPAWVERDHGPGLRHIVGTGSAATEG